MRKLTYIVAACVAVFWAAACQYKEPSCQAIKVANDLCLTIRMEDGTEVKLNADDVRVIAASRKPAPATSSSAGAK